MMIDGDMDGCGASALAAMGRLTSSTKSTFSWWRSNAKDMPIPDASEIQARMKALWRSCMDVPAQDLIVVSPVVVVWQRRMSQVIKRGYYIRRWHGKARNYRRLNFWRKT